MHALRSSLRLARAGLPCLLLLGHPVPARAQGKPPLAQPAPSPGAADPAHEAAARMQRFYEGTRDLHARFEQEQRTALGGVKKAAGEVWLKKPGRMRWDYQKPEKKLMVADGKTLWVYEPEDEQAFRHELAGSSLPSSVAFLFGTGKLGEEFDISELPATPERKLEPGDVVLKLVPRKATPQYRYLEFVVDGKSHMVKQSVLYDQQGGENHLRFLDVKVNQGVSDGKFGFSPPAGTRIIRP